MSLISLKAVNFRNFDSLFLETGPGLNILIGPNGSGKTSFLEAISYLCFSKSFRTNSDQDLLKEKADYFQLKGLFQQKNQSVELQANFLKKGGKKFIQNGIPLTRLSDVVGIQPLVIQSPEDIRITLGSSKEKRLYFNRLISQMMPPFLDDLILFNRLLKQRNAWLKKLKEKTIFLYDTQLEIYDDQLSEVNYSIYQTRKEMISYFLNHFIKIYKEFYPKEETLPEIRYSASINQDDKKRYIEKYIEKSKQKTESEIVLSRTLQGANYDKIKFFRNKRDLESSASQGEHKLWMTIMKLTEGVLLQENQEKDVLFIFDDLFSELDLEKTALIINKVKKYKQVLISSTDLSDIRRHGMDIDESIVKVLNFDKNC